jgi:hypothetical protein
MMNEHRLFDRPNASFTNVLLPSLKVAARRFDKLVILDPIADGWTWNTEDHGV